MKRIASLILIAVLLCLLPAASMAEDGSCKVKVFRADGTLATPCTTPAYIGYSGSFSLADHDGDYCIASDSLNDYLNLHESNLVVKASEDGAPIDSIVARGQNTITLTLDSLSLRTENQFGFFTDAENATLNIKGKTSISANTFAPALNSQGNLTIRIADGASLTSVSESSVGCIWADGDLSIYGSNMFIDGGRIPEAIGSSAVRCKGKFTLNGSNITIHATDVDGTTFYSFPGSGIAAGSGVEINGDNITITGASSKESDGGHGIACLSSYSHMLEEGGDVIINGNNITILGGSATVSAEPLFSPQAGYAIAAKNIAITGYNFQASSGAGGVGPHEALYTEGSLILGTPAEESADQRVWTPTTQSTLRFFRTLPLPVSHPATGDGANLALWTALAIVSAAGAVLLLRKRKAA